MSTREDWLINLVGELRPIFDAHGFPLPDKIRVTCGFPSRHARALNRAMGEWHSPSASADGHHEIFISPVESDPYQVMGIVVHELAHSATPADGHRGSFPRLVRKMHLEGIPSATRIGSRFKDEFASILDVLGEYPHSNLDVTADRKTQSTRMLKAYCPDCGYTVRLSHKWAFALDINGDSVPHLPVCPTDGKKFVL